MADTHYHPRIEEFFPRLRRGHGTTHAKARIDKEGFKVREANPCANDLCSLKRMKGGEQHYDPKANVNEWREDHGIKKDLPLDQVFPAYKVASLQAVRSSAARMMSQHRESLERLGGRS